MRSASWPHWSQKGIGEPNAPISQSFAPSTSAKNPSPSRTNPVALPARAAFIAGRV